MFEGLKEFWTSPTGRKTGLIIGLVFGGILFVAILGSLFGCASTEYYKKVNTPTISVDSVANGSIPTIYFTLSNPHSVDLICKVECCNPIDENECVVATIKIKAQSDKQFSVRSLIGLSCLRNPVCEREG